MNADPQRDPAVLGHIGVAQGHAALDVHRTGDRVHHAGKLHQNAVADQLEDAALVRLDPAVDQAPPVRLERGQRSRLVQPHQAAVAHHIGGKDRRKAALGAGFLHAAAFGKVYRVSLEGVGGPVQRTPKPWYFRGTYNSGGSTARS